MSAMSNMSVTQAYEVQVRLFMFLDHMWTVCQYLHYVPIGRMDTTTIEVVTE